MSSGSELSPAERRRMLAIAKEFVEFHLSEVQACRRHARQLLASIEEKRKVPSAADIKACVPTGLSEMALMNVNAALARLELDGALSAFLENGVEFEPAPVIALTDHAADLAS